MYALVDIPDSIQRVWSETRTSSNNPAESEGSQEWTLKATDKDDGLCI